MPNLVLNDIKGNILTLDPKSKVLTSIVMIIGVSLSIEPFSVLIFLLFAILLIILYRPNPRFIKRVIIVMPFSILISTIIFLTIKSDVTVHIFYFSRSYTSTQFAWLVLYRFFVSVLHTVILLESETNRIDIIEVIASFRISQILVSILFLINKLAVQLQNDYIRMIDSAKARGMLNMNRFHQLFFKIRLMSLTINRAITNSNKIADTLIIRGFDGQFSITIRTWTSEGISVLILGITMALFSIFMPLIRPYM